MRGLEYHVLSHTHWDREWYLTFQQFRRLLVHLLDDLLEVLENDKRFEHFHLDGQTICLEDYLEVRPENEPRLKKLIKQGRIAVGPWYVLNDNFLTHGESTIRNLMIGHKIAQEFGGVCKVGYLPDQFGNISQMPQILQGFSIPCAIFGRGYIPGEDRKSEIRWQAPDGTSVFALHLSNWYNNFMRPSSEARQAQKELKEAGEKLLPFVSTPFLLMMNGCDHLGAQAEIGRLIKSLNRSMKGAKVIHTRLEDYLAKVAEATEEPTVHQGEFREDRERQILANTLSTRVAIKQRNSHCEHLLLSTETIHLLSHIHGGLWDSNYLEMMWKLLLSNHAHDSICGCSIDQVHREMMPRFDQVEQMAEELTAESLKHLAAEVKFPAKSTAPAVLAVNPSSSRRNSIVEVEVDYPAEDDKGNSLRVPRHIGVLDEKGNPCVFQLIKCGPAKRAETSLEHLPREVGVQRFQIQIPTTFESFQYRTFQVVGKKTKSPSGQEKVRSGNNRLENSQVQVMVGGDGSVAIRHKKTGFLFGPLLVFEDDGDIGDEYLFKSPANDRTVSTQGRPAQIRQVAVSPYQGTLQIERIVPIPSSADLNDERRVRDTVDCVISTRITLRAGDPMLYCETRLDNRAQFHRLRVLFQSNLETDRAYADSPFDIIERHAFLPEKWKEGTRQMPLRSFVALKEEDKGLAVLTKGLHEYQLIDTQLGKVALTLLRCVGHLMHGPSSFYRIETPEAQCPGIQRMEYAVYPFSGEEEFVSLPQSAEAYNRPVRALVFDPQAGKSPRSRQLAEVKPEGVLVTAAKRADDRRAIVLRMVNTAAEEVEAEISCGWSVKQAYSLDMLEKRGKELSCRGKKASITLRPREIATVELVV